MAAIFYLSALSSPPVPGNVNDKLLHTIEYFGLGLLVFRAIAGGLLRRPSATTVAFCLLITVAYAASDEMHQFFTPDRTPDVRDLLADATGATLALIVTWACHIIASSSTRASNPKSQL